MTRMLLGIGLPDSSRVESIPALPATADIGVPQSVEQIEDQLPPIAEIRSWYLSPEIAVAHP